MSAGQTGVVKEKWIVVGESDGVAVGIRRVGEQTVGADPVPLAVAAAWWTEWCCRCQELWLFRFVAEVIIAAMVYFAVYETDCFCSTLSVVSWVT